MPKKTYTEEQIAAALRQAEAGTPVTELCRKLGVTEQSFYRWKRKFAGMGMGVAELRRLKQLVTDLTLNKQMLQKVVGKKL